VEASIPTSKADVIAYLRRALAPGALYHGAIKVLLEDDDYEGAWGDAVLWYIENMGQTKQTTLTLSAGTVEYDAPSDMDRLVEFIPPGVDAYGAAYTGFGFEANGFPVAGWTGSNPGMPMTDIANGLQQVGQLNGLLGTGFYAEFDAVRRKIITSPAGATGSSIIRYVSTDLTFSTLPIRHRRWIRAYAVASAKSRLGLVLSRYDSVEGASGTVTMTQRLIDDAELEKQTVVGEIRDAVDPHTIFTG
jgi:hypothetical protein